MNSWWPKGTKDEGEVIEISAGDSCCSFPHIEKSRFLQSATLTRGVHTKKARFAQAGKAAAHRSQRRADNRKGSEARYGARGTKRRADNLRNLARKSGFDPDRFEVQLDYDRLKHFDFSKIRNTMGYVAILAGPMPHSTPGAKEASSFIARVDAHNDEYPPRIRLEAGDDLKITNNSFKRALRELHHLGAA